MFTSYEIFQLKFELYIFFKIIVLYIEMKR